MPQVTQDFSPRTIGEKVLYSVDFQLNLASGENILSAVWTCAVEQGSSDPNAAARVSGVASFSGTVTSQLIDFSTAIGPITSGTQYILSAQITTSFGQTLIGYGHVPGVFAET